MFKKSFVVTLALIVSPHFASADGLRDLLRNREDILVGEKNLSVAPAKRDDYTYGSPSVKRTFQSFTNKERSYRVEFETADGKIQRLSEFDRETLKDGRPGALWMTTNRFENGKLTTRTRCDSALTSTIYGYDSNQVADCVTVTPAFCARTKRAIKEITKKDMGDYSKDLRACTDTLKGITGYNLVGVRMIEDEYARTVEEEKAVLIGLKDRVVEAQEEGKKYEDLGAVRMFGEPELEKGAKPAVQALKYFSALQSAMEDCLVLEKLNPDLMKEADRADASGPEMLIKKVKGAK